MDNKSIFDLISIVYIFGGTIAIDSLRYINFLSCRNFTALFVIPGLSAISEMLFKLFDSDEDMQNIMGLKSSNKYRYIGMSSGTNAFVRNAICEGWLNTVTKNSDGILKKSKLFNPVGEGKKTTIFVAKIKNSRFGEHIVLHASNDKLFTAVQVTLQVCSVITLLLLILYSNDTVGIIIIAVNMFVYQISIMILSNNKFFIPNATPSVGVPSGNSLILDQSGDNMCVVLGNEPTIQNFMQFETPMQKNIVNRYISTAISLLGFIVFIATILAMYTASTYAKIMFGIEMLLGFLHNILCVTKSSDKICTEIAENYYSSNKSFTKKINAKKITYTNRAASVAAIVFFTKGKAKNIGTLVPEHDSKGNWPKYRQLLDDIVEDKKYKELLYRIEECSNKEEAVHLLCTRFPKSAGSLYCNEENYKSWLEILHTDIETNRSDQLFQLRLIVDVLEGLVDCERLNITWTR